MRRLLSFMLVLCTLVCAGLLASCGNTAADNRETSDRPADKETAFQTETDPESAKESETEKVKTAEYDYVALIGVDGSGNAFQEVDSPNYDAIFEKGAVKLDSRAMDPTNSAENWASMLHGVLPSKHRRNNTNTGQEAYPEGSAYPSLFALLHEQRPQALTASFVNWNNINFGIVENNIGVHKQNIGSDAALTDAICEYVRDRKPVMLFVQLDEVDHIGHTYGYTSPEYYAQLEKADEMIGKIYDAYEEAGILDRTLFMVAADHGGLNKGHGGTSDVERTVAFAAAGRTVIEGGTIGPMDQRDIAAIAAYALGIEPADTWTGRVPTGIFEGVGSVDRQEEITLHRTHETVPTPAFDGPDSVSRYVDEDLIAYLTFDETIDDECGGPTRQTGNLDYDDGFFGDALHMAGGGYVTLEDYKPGVDNFTVAIWVKTKGVSGEDPCLCSNKDWMSGKNPGFVFALRRADVKFNAGTGSDRVDLTCPLPEDYKDGWMHLTLVVDRDRNEIRVYYDFTDPYVLKMPASFEEASFNSFDGLNIGQDGTGHLGLTLEETLLDEFMLFDAALTSEEVRQLGAYYGVK